MSSRLSAKKTFRVSDGDVRYGEGIERLRQVVVTYIIRSSVQRKIKS